MSLVNVTSTDTSNVTFASDEISTHTFNYSLNEAKTKKKLYDGANRKPFEKEEKKASTILIFSDGAFTEVVLNAIIEIKNGPKHFIIGKESVERISIDRRDELMGRHMDTKIQFEVNGEKITMHVYNSTQKIMIQGKRYKWFVENYLEPFLKIRISRSLQKIKQINETIKTSIHSTLNKELSKEN